MFGRACTYSTWLLSGCSTSQRHGITCAANMACSALPAACASVADTETAFRLYGELRAEGVRTDCQVYTALITACSRRIQGSAGYISRWTHAVYQAGLCSTLQAVVGISTGSQLLHSTHLHLCIAELASCARLAPSSVKLRAACRRGLCCLAANMSPYALLYFPHMLC